MRKLILIRGLPGAGKSTTAKQICTNEFYWKHLEADQFFVNSQGEYKFDQNHICDAHDWCQRQKHMALFDGVDVVVSNTFTTVRELKPYFEIAKSFSIVPNVILCQGNFGSIHGVPDATLTKMKARFQYDISSLYN